MLLTLVACAPSDADLATAVQANSRALDGVLLGLEALEVKLDRHTAGDGRYGYNGTLGAGPGWSSGQVQVVGESVFEQDGTLGSYALELEYSDLVTTTSALDGTLAWDVVERTGDGRVDLDYVVVGTLTVDGAWEAELDYTRDITPTDDGFDEAWTGTINGTDVSSLL